MKKFSFSPHPIYILFCTLLLLFSCSDRERSNPFEMQEPGEFIELTLKPTANYVDLEWRLTQDVSTINGFRIYRSVNSPENFSVIAQVTGTARSYRDNAVQPGNRYYYKITAVGAALESAPSNLLNTLIGPGSWWVLTTDDRNVKLLSYDLQHVIKDYRTEFLSNVWATPTGSDSLFWLTTPPFVKSIVSLNRYNGREDFFYFDSLAKADDLSYNSSEKQLFVLDATRKKLIVITNNNFVGSVKLNLAIVYRKIKYNNAASLLFLTGSAGVELYTTDGSLPVFTNIFEFESGFSGQDISVVGSTTYVLAASQNTSIIYQFDGANLLRTIQLEGRYNHITAIDQQTFLLSEFIEIGDDALVKMDINGTILFRKVEFGLISAIGYNPIDHTIVVADYTKNLITLHDDSGNRISESRDHSGNKILREPLQLFFEQLLF
jgi:hypothetical protein